MRLGTVVFDLCPNHYRNLSELSAAMGISVSEVCRVRNGKRNINQKFIVGALRAFPQFSLDTLFYIVPDLPADDTTSPTDATLDKRQRVQAYEKAQDETPLTICADGERRHEPRSGHEVPNGQERVQRS